MEKDDSSDITDKNELFSSSSQSLSFSLPPIPAPPPPFNDL